MLERYDTFIKSRKAYAVRSGSQLKSLFLGGILPVIVFTVLEEKYGTLWGLVGGMVFGIGEILYEWFSRRKVDTITWIGNGLLIAMGVFSLWTNEGIWFKLQPAIIEVFMAVVLIGSVFLKKPFMSMMAEKQNLFAQLPPEFHDTFRKGFSGMTFRIGIFFLLHAGLAAWAALYWSTRAWAILKGVGFTVSMIVYMAVEVFLIRRTIMLQKRTAPQKK